MKSALKSDLQSPSVPASNFALSNPQETATALGVSCKTIYYWVSRNEIPFIKVGRHLRFNINSVIEYFQLKTNATRPCLPYQELLKPITVIGENSLRRSLKTRSVKSVSSPEKGD